jgi:hypothetical protein
MQSSEPDHGAPEGASCAEHPDRPAAFTCPRCGKHACIFCWHALAVRCESCMQSDPAAAAPPLAWETPGGSLFGRYFATLGSAFRPVFTAPAFAQGDLRPALRFFLLSALPIAALAGVIPYTTTLLFGGAFSVAVQGQPSANGIALDIVAAMFIALGVFSFELAALWLPYVSLVRAYAPERRAAATRVLLYRSWLIPFASLVVFASLWVLPAPIDPKTPPVYLPLVGFAQLTLDALLLVSMRATARLACGIRPLLSYVVVAVPFVIWMFVQLIITRGLLAVAS